MKVNSDDRNICYEAIQNLSPGSRSTTIISTHTGKLIEDRNGQGNLDYAVKCRSTGRVLGVIEVKKEDFMKGFAQVSVQMESTLSRKRKADEIDNGQDVLGLLPMHPNDENLQAKVEKDLGHIVWILEKAQKPVEALQSGVKRVKSLSNIAGKLN
ncbi:uncharacterized protein OCT59_008106 [Rhizophagus irregularis]|uniref:uncharacterized protein n=1 Tax=Rhizophagus irregularis TaxID=588596 RepID=UPI001A07DC1E|nr:hypothetical protein OCT59_008106 [Rhizophagus irregularis]GBC42816.2 hypothetical protein GLOIN_2v1867626 [Rhizophagus irregularis DAOM 181602=DAOM 197198]